MVKRYGDEDKPSLQELSHIGVKGMKWGRRKAHPELAAVKDKIAKQKKETKEANKAKKESDKVAAAKAKLEKKLYDQSPEGKKARMDRLVKNMEKVSKFLGETMDEISSDEFKIYNQLRETDPKLAERYREEQKKFNPNYNKPRR